MFFQETKIDYSNRHKNLVDFIAEKEKEKNLGTCLGKIF